MSYRHRTIQRYGCPQQGMRRRNWHRSWVIGHRAFLRQLAMEIFGPGGPVKVHYKEST